MERAGEARFGAHHLDAPAHGVIPHLEDPIAVPGRFLPHVFPSKRRECLDHEVVPRFVSELFRGRRNKVRADSEGHTNLRIELQCVFNQMQLDETYDNVNIPVQ